MTFLPTRNSQFISAIPSTLVLYASICTGSLANWFCTYDHLCATARADPVRTKLLVPIGQDAQRERDAKV